MRSKEPKAVQLVLLTVRTVTYVQSSFIPGMEQTFPVVTG
jgi:hypothetical protein